MCTSIVPMGRRSSGLSRTLVVVARNYGLSEKQLAEVLKVVKEKHNDIADAWRERFRR